MTPEEAAYCRRCLSWFHRKERHVCVPAARVIPRQRYNSRTGQFEPAPPPAEEVDGEC